MAEKVLHDCMKVETFQSSSAFRSERAGAFVVHVFSSREMRFGFSDPHEVRTSGRQLLPRDISFLFILVTRLK